MHVDCPLMENTTLVPQTPETTGFARNTSSQGRRPTTNTQHKENTPITETNATNCVPLIRTSLQKCKFSKNVETYIMESWRPNTQQRYKSILDK